MGVRETFKGFRSEVSRLFNYDSDKTTPSTYVSDLVDEEVWDRDQITHLRDVVWKDAVANYICVKLSENVFDDGFVFKREMGDEEEIMQDVQQELIRMNAKFWLTKALIDERTYGDARLYTGPNTYREDYKNGYQIAQLDCFNKENSDLVDYDPDTGQPQAVKVYYNPENLSMYKILPYGDFIHIYTRPIGREYDGYPACYACWDELAYIRLSEHALGWSNMKYGLGLFLWRLKGRVTAESQAALETMLENISVMRAGMYDSNIVESVDFVGPPQSGANNIVEGIDMYLGLVSAGTGVPKDILTGVSAGAITGSEMNNKALYATINKIQESMKPYIRELIRRMGYLDEDYVIEFNTRYATDELEQAQIDLLKAQAEQLRAQIASGMFMQQPMGDKQEKNQNQTGVQS